MIEGIDQYDEAENEESNFILVHYFIIPSIC